MPRIRVLLADDHEMVREGLKSILNAAPDVEVVGEADSGVTAVARARALKPHVVVMDVSMARMNGLQATNEIVRTCRDTRVLVLTRHAERAYLQEMLGASGYVLKQSRASAIVAALRAVAAGDKFLDPVMTGFVVAEIARTAPAPGPRRATLSPREEEVLRLVALGCSNKEVAAQLNLSVKTVETHKAHGMEKLGLRNRVDVVQLGALRGWLSAT